MKKTFFLSAVLMLMITSCLFAQPSRILELQDDKTEIAGAKTAPVIKQNYDCLLDNPFAFGAYYSWVAEEKALDTAPQTISISEENSFGDKMYSQMVQSGEYKFITGAQLQALNEIMNELLNYRYSSKSGLRYTMHLIDNNNINAFTAGGHIYVNTGIINYCKSISELACIIAHEIGHNEMKDINRTLKRIKIAGNFGNMLYSMKELFTMSFNQFNEVRVDCYGTDLARSAGYNACKSVQLWKRMASDHNEDPTLLAKFFRTHPFSIERANCLNEHIKENYNQDCN